MTLSSQEIPTPPPSAMGWTPLPLLPLPSSQTQPTPRIQMAPQPPSTMEWTPLSLLPVPSSQSQRKPKPSMTIPIPSHSYHLSEQTTTPLSSSSSSSSTLLWASTPNSPTQTPLTSGQATPVSDTFSLDPYSFRPKPIHRCRLRQVDENGQPLDVLERTYYKPIDELDTAEALDARPLPGTFRYAMEMEKELTGEGRRLRKEKTSEQKREEFERVKRMLRGN